MFWLWTTGHMKNSYHYWTQNKIQLIKPCFAFSRDTLLENMIKLMEALWQSYLKLSLFWNINPGQCVQIRFQISEEYKGISGFESMKMRTQEKRQVEDLETNILGKLSCDIDTDPSRLWLCKFVPTILLCTTQYFSCMY